MAGEVEIERLVTRFEADLSDLRTSTDRIEKMLGGTADKIGKRFTAIGRTVRGAIATVVSGASVKGIVDVNVAYDDLEGRLRSLARGDAPLARAAFKELRDFSRLLPADVDQVTSAFIRLNRLGLDASREAIVDYANIAGAVGTRGTRSLEQVVEALADAVTFEFERLKELGIRARKEGDTITFTFGDITREVKADSRSIQGFLRDLARVEFAGAATEQMDTLGASLGRLSGAFRESARKIGESGFNDAVSQAADTAAEALPPITDFAISATGDVAKLGQRLRDIFGGAMAAGVAGVTGNFERMTNIIQDVARGGRLEALAAGTTPGGAGTPRQIEERNSTQILRTLRSIDSSLTVTNLQGAVLQ